MDIDENDQLYSLDNQDAFFFFFMVKGDLSMVAKLL